MRRRALVAAAVSILIAAPASAQSVTGRWRVDGRDARSGAFQGSIEIKQDARGLRYERSVRFATTGRADVEYGSVELRGNDVLTSSDPSASTGFVGVVGSARVRRASLARVSARLEGNYSVVGGAQDERGQEKLDRFPSSGGDSFELLVDGTEFYPRLETALRSAKKSICVETFAWHPDQEGSLVCSLLAERARAGVEVRVIPDSIGAKLAKSVIDGTKPAGVEVQWANPILGSVGNSFLELGRDLLGLFGFSSPHEKHGISNRDHRKVILIDGLYGFTGGMGFGDHYKKWHDVMCRFEGPVVARVQAEFFDRWSAYGGKKPPRDSASYVADRSGLPPAGDTKLEVFASVPGLRREGKQTYLREITGARRRVWVENPYFLDDDIVSALENKARSGVPTTVIVPNDHDQDEAFVREAMIWIQNDVVASGVDFRKYRDRMVHAKVATIDGTWSTVGSHNLDTLSLEKLSELNVASHDPRLARVLETRIFEKDVPTSDKVVAQKLGFWQSIKSGVMHFFRGMI